MMALAVVDVVSCFTVVADVLVVTDAMVDRKHYSLK